MQLQKLYKTDEKIGERLGGVPAYLVAYWRRKKNVAKHAQPKFSEAEVKNLWERFGDDEKAGLELGLSKAAFYNWRRRYGIREKPAFLKLEQLEFEFPGAKVAAHANNLYGRQTMAQKLLARAAGQERVEVGEMVTVEPDLVIIDGGLESLVAAFKAQGVEYVWNPAKVALIDSGGESSAPVTIPSRVVREFARRQRLRPLIDYRDGSGYQVILERGWLLPGQLVVGNSPHVSAMGVLSSLSIARKEASMAELIAKGMFEMEVPATVRLGLSGRRPRGIYPRDIMLEAIARLGTAALAGKVIELAGPLVSQLSMSERITLSTLAAELGACGAICPYDSLTRRFLTGRSSVSYRPVIPDKNAEYTEQYQIGVESLTPRLLDPTAGVKPVSELDGLPAPLIVLGTLANGRFDDLRIAAEILKGKQVHPDCRLVVIPASHSVYLEALKKGLLRLFIEAGAIILPTTGQLETRLLGALGANERCLIAADLATARTLAGPTIPFAVVSPATAAVSALNGAITDPTRFVR